MMLKPKEVVEYAINGYKAKANKSMKDLMLQAFLAGTFIAMGAIGYFKLAGAVEDPGVGLFLGALIFPTGIILVLFFPAELFTSDNLAMLSWWKRELKLSRLLNYLSVVWVFNLIGAIFIAFLVFQSHILPEGAVDKLSHVVQAKVTKSPSTLFFSAVLCNFIVSAAVWITYTSKDAISKIWLVWFPIALFVISGTEHVVANMFYLFAGKFLGTDVSFMQIAYNLSIVTIGNMVGGGIVVGGINYLIHEYKPKNN